MRRNVSKKNSTYVEYFNSFNLSQSSLFITCKHLKQLELNILIPNIHVTSQVCDRKLRLNVNKRHLSGFFPRLCKKYY